MSDKYNLYPIGCVQKIVILRQISIHEKNINNIIFSTVIFIWSNN